MSSIERSLLLCNSAPKDEEAWQELCKSLERRGSSGPLLDFVKQQLRKIKGSRTRNLILKRAQKAWEPLLNQGFVVFNHKPANSVFHIGRLLGVDSNGSLLVRESYPFGWQFYFLNLLCGTSPHSSYPGGAWTQEKTPPEVGLHPPCATCLKKLEADNSRRWFWQEGETPLTQVQIDRLWDLKKPK